MSYATQKENKPGEMKEKYQITYHASAHHRPETIEADNYLFLGTHQFYVGDTVVLDLRDDEVKSIVKIS